MRFNIRRKLFIFFVLPGILFFSFYIAYSIFNTEKIMYSLHQKNYADLVSGYASVADIVLSNRSKDAYNTAKIIEKFTDLTENELYSLLAVNAASAQIVFGSTIAFEPYAYKRDVKFYAPFVYKTANGLDSTIIGFDYTSSNLDWYEIPKKTEKPHWSEPYYSDVINNIKLVSYSVPFFRGGKFTGVVTIDFALEPLNDIFRKIFKHQSTQFSIISEKGKYISNQNSEKILEKSIFDESVANISKEYREKIGKAMISQKSGFLKLTDPTNNNIVWGYYSPILTPNWSISVIVNENELNGPIKKVFLESIILLAVAVFIAIILLAFVINRGLKPLKQLQDFSKEIRDGNYNARISLKANDEISDLANDLNIMGQQLEKREKELQEINTNLEQKVERRTVELQSAKESTDRIIDTSPMPIAITDRITGEVIRANMALAEFHKISLAEVYKTTTPDWYWANSVRDSILVAIKENGKLINFEIEAKRYGTSEKRWALLSIFPIQYLNRDAFIVVMSDITEMKEANIKINSQNLEISERNKYISDSINYAQRIQNSILPSDLYFEKLFPNYFLIFRPKDIVSGDFYWASKVGSKKIVAAVDCTGHGVPGALMSMIGNTLLNEIVNFGKETNPAEILNKLNKRVNEELNKDVNKQTYDGMDAAICVIDEESKILEYSGAYRPLYYFKDGEFFEIKGDRKSIGDIKKEKISFTSKTIELNDSVVFYLYSDGYVDQHNEENKKFGSKRFKELLSNIHSSDIEEQKGILLDELKSHSGNEVQRDDITILGIRPMLTIQNLDEVLFKFNGEFTHSKIIEIGEEIEEKLGKRFDSKIIRTIHFCSNELMQNIGFYSKEIKESGIGSYSIEFNHSNNNITLVCSNNSTADSIKDFTNRLDGYNSLNQDELKSLYKEKLKSESHEGSKGAGIGLIQILRKTKNKIDYITKIENDNLSLITLKIKITE